MVPDDCAPAAVALLAAALLTLVSCAGVAATPAARGRRPSARHATGWERCVRPTLRRRLVVSIFAIGSLYTVEPTVVAIASERGDRGSAGLLIGAFSSTSALGHGGGAVASSLAGVEIERQGPGARFLTAAAMAATAALVAAARG